MSQQVTRHTVLDFFWRSVLNSSSLPACPLLGHARRLCLSSMSAPAAPADLCPEDLALRLSPGFTVVFEGERLPLRALTQLDGFGRLGLFLVFSDHEGVQPLRHWAEDFGVPADEALQLAQRPDTFTWCTLTEPQHDAADRRATAPHEVAMRPQDYDRELAGVTAAGLARPTGRTNSAGAPVYALVDAHAWELLEIQPQDENEA